MVSPRLLHMSSEVSNRFVLLLPPIGTRLKTPLNFCQCLKNVTIRYFILSLQALIKLRKGQILVITYHENQRGQVTQNASSDQPSSPLRTGCSSPYPSDFGPLVSGRILCILPFHVHFPLLHSWATKVLGGVSQPEALSHVAQVQQSDVEDVLQRPGVGRVGADEGLQGCKKNEGEEGSQGGSRGLHAPLPKAVLGRASFQATASSTTYIAMSIYTGMLSNSSETNKNPPTTTL